VLSQLTSALSNFWLAIGCYVISGHLAETTLYSNGRQSVDRTVHTCIRWLSLRRCSTNSRHDALSLCLVPGVEISHRLLCAYVWSSGRQHLWSVRRCQLSVPCAYCSTFGRRAFSVDVPTVWNSLPDDLQDSAIDFEHFRPDFRHI